jgi:hypothetical protein
MSNERLNAMFKNVDDQNKPYLEWNLRCKAL